MSIWFCTACGTPTGSEGDRCPHCGTPRQQTAPPPQLPPLPPPPPTGPVPIAQYEVMAPGFQEQPTFEQPPPPVFEQPPPGFEQPAFVPAENYGPSPAPPPPVQPPASGRRLWVPVLVAGVVLLAIVAIASVFILDRGDDGDKIASPAASPTATPTAGAPTATPTRASPSATAGSSAPPARLVATDPSVADPRAVDVATMFETYFTAINNRDYDQALTAYDPAGAINPNNTKQATDFKQGISTTTDTEIVLRSVGPPASGRGVLDARVTFHSNQQPGYGPKERPNETCTAWDVTYALSQPSGGYRILAGKASHSPC